MRLTDLDANFVDAGGPGVTKADGSPVPHRRGVGVSFNCPCGCDSRCYVAFSNPLDGGPPHDQRKDFPKWDRTGETLDTLTLQPSIQRIGGCKWHGYITNGDAHI